MRVADNQKIEDLKVCKEAIHLAVTRKSSLLNQDIEILKKTSIKKSISKSRTDVVCGLWPSTQSQTLC